MLRRRNPSHTRLAVIALLGFLATTLLPRDAWYVHRHAGDGHGHVHAWDGARVAGSTTSVRDLRHDHAHGDDHEHDHAPGDDAAHEHDVPAQHDHRTVVRAPDGEAHDDHAHGEHEDGGRLAQHDPDHAAPAAASAAEGDADGPQLEPPHAGSHTHWQSPFQITAATTAPPPTVLDVRWVDDVTTHAASPEQRARDWRARAPPISV